MEILTLGVSTTSNIKKFKLFSLSKPSEQTAMVLGASSIDQAYWSHCEHWFDESKRYCKVYNLREESIHDMDKVQSNLSH